MVVENVATSDALTVEVINVDDLADSNYEVLASKVAPIEGAKNVVSQNVRGNIFKTTVPKTAMTKPPTSIVANPSPSSSKKKKVPFTFRRTKTTKEIVQEQKEKWEKEKIEKKAKLRMEQIRFVEEQKQKRHEQRCQVIEKLSDKL